MAFLDAAVDAALCELAAYWDDLLGIYHLECGDKKLSRMVNVWHQYQPLTKRGYNERFGLIYVDYNTLERISKDSAAWYANVIETNGENL